MSNELHDKIMRLPCIAGTADLVGKTDAEVRAYHIGHRDARHAVAELALGYVPAPASGAALSGEPVFPLSLLEEIAQKRAESIPGPGGFPCTQSEIASFKKAFLKEWMPRAIAQAPKAALTEKAIDTIWESLPGLTIIKDKPQDQWNRLLRHEFAAAIEAATAPNAKLVAALQNIVKGCYPSAICAEARAALADAGVPVKGE